ncbi:MAG: hypothetical protein ABS81_07020 [Pseudonocardia sp. SCN 72-86]|nr:MAG: hypothetical protein ABS81_07020 [Pseudonocardia sp. SCN 72-86]
METSDATEGQHLARIELVLSFVNTRADAGRRTELFEAADGFALWAGRLGLLDESAMVTDADASFAREMRGALVTMLLAHADDPTISSQTLRSAENFLRQIADRYPLVSTLSADGAELRAASGGVTGTLGTILAAATEAALTDEWRRLKACGNPPCRNGFVDRSRNRTQRFCSPGCGSQVSMRAFRQRKKQLHPTE